MKNLIALFMVLITTPVFAVKIDANTPIEWKCGVIREALKRSGAEKVILDELLCDGAQSVSELVSRCVSIGSYWHINDISEKCKKFGEELVVVNNEFYTKLTDKSSCKKDQEFIWLDNKNICVPKNPCNSEMYSEYCEKHDDMEYIVPKGKATEIDVINMYAEYKNFGCEVSKKLIFKDNGYVYVPCIGNNYKVFMFSENKELGILTDLLCRSGFMVHHYGHPTYCRGSEEKCNEIKKFVNGRIKVEWRKYGDGYCCQIGELSDEYYIGEIYNGSLDVKRMMKK